MPLTAGAMAIRLGLTEKSEIGLRVALPLALTVESMVIRSGPVDIDLRGALLSALAAEAVAIRTGLIVIDSIVVLLLALKAKLWR
jgi:hypothetical protein